MDLGSPLGNGVGESHTGPGIVISGHHLSSCARIRSAPGVLSWRSSCRWQLAADVRAPLDVGLGRLRLARVRYFDCVIYFSKGSIRHRAVISVRASREQQYGPLCCIGCAASWPYWADDRRSKTPRWSWASGCPLTRLMRGLFFFRLGEHTRTAVSIGPVQFQGIWFMFFFLLLPFSF